MQFIITKLLSVFSIFDTGEAALAYLDSIRQPGLRVSANRYAGVSILNVEGAFTGQTDISRFRTTIDEAIQGGSISAIILCPQILHIDGEAVEVFIASRQLLFQQQGGDLMLAGIEPRLAPEVDSHGTCQRNSHIRHGLDQALYTLGLAA